MPEEVKVEIRMGLTDYRQAEENGFRLRMSGGASIVEVVAVHTVQLGDGGMKRITEFWTKDGKYIGVLAG